MSFCVCIQPFSTILCLVIHLSGLSPCSHIVRWTSTPGGFWSKVPHLKRPMVWGVLLLFPEGIYDNYGKHCLCLMDVLELLTDRLKSAIETIICRNLLGLVWFSLKSCNFPPSLPSQNSLRISHINLGASSIAWQGCWYLVVSVFKLLDESFAVSIMQTVSLDSSGQVRKRWLWTALLPLYMSRSEEKEEYELYLLFL